MTEPTLVIRTDTKAAGLGCFPGLTVDQLRNALAELPGCWEVMPNGVHNLALCEFGPRVDDPEDITRWYIGYIDMVTGEVFVKPGVKPPAERPGDPENVPWREDVRAVWLDGSTFEANEP